MKRVRDPWKGPMVHEIVKTALSAFTNAGMVIIATNGRSTTAITVLAPIPVEDVTTLLSAYGLRVRPYTNNPRMLRVLGKLAKS